MKYTKLFLMVILVLIQTTTLAQQAIIDNEISISFDDVTLRDALNQLENRSGLSFSYNNNLSEFNQIKNATFKNASLENIIDDLLGGTSLSYKRFEKQISIFPEGNQPKGLINGIVLSNKTGLPLPIANVIIKGTKIGTTTNEEGYFEINELLDGNYTIIISYIGFEPFSIKDLIIQKGNTLSLSNIKLKPNVVSLNEITVSPGSYSIMKNPQLKQITTLSERNIQSMAWADDITRSVSRLPGISASDYSSKFAIRGGEDDEVLISLDGMELYEPFHQRDVSGGLFSIVDIEAIRGLDLMTGGFSAENGNRLSGVFAMKTKNAMDNEHHLSLSLSFMNAGIYADGKFANNRGSYLFSARRGMLDLSLKAIGDDEFFPNYYDGLAKVEYKLTEKQILSLNILHSGDNAFFNNSPEPETLEEFDTEYVSTYSWLTLKSFYSEKLYSRTILYTGNINHLRKGDLDKYEWSDKGSFHVDDQRDYTFFGLKQDWKYEFNDKLHIKYGFDAKTLNANYDNVSSIYELRTNVNDELYYFDRDLDIQLNPKGEQLGTYIDTRFKILPKLIAETGIRYDYASYTGDRNWSPRVSLAYVFGKNTFLRAGWGHYYQTQFINGIDVTNGEMDFDSAELSKHNVLGLEHLFNNGISLRSEVYYKDMTNIHPIWQNLRDHLESFPEARNDNVKVAYNGIISKGIELFLKYDEGNKISWWFSYALAQATDDIKDIEYDGLLVKRTGEVPRLNDQRHTIYADINYRPDENWHFNASWQYYKGWPRTDYTLRYIELPNGDSHFYASHGEFNGKLYPAYHRLDLKINKRFNLKNTKLTAFLHLVNVYNHENLKKFDLDAENDAGELSIDGNGNYIPVRDDVYWLGFLPVIGLKLEF